MQTKFKPSKKFRAKSREENKDLRQILKQLFTYSKKTGLFTRRTTVSGGFNKGDIAGYSNNKGYTCMRVAGKDRKAHRMAFLYVKGYIPKQVDHDNRIKDDNRWKNLKPSNNAHNQHNVPIRADNTSGHVGVTVVNKGSSYTHVKYQARITFKSVRRNLGFFETFEEAVAARKKAEKELGYHVNHGSV